MKQNACQFQIIKETLLKKGYVSRNDMLKKYISRTSKYIQDLRKDYVIDTIHYKPSRKWYNQDTWGECIYLLRNKKGEKSSRKYKILLNYFTKTNQLKVKNISYFTNEI